MTGNVRFAARSQWPLPPLASPIATKMTQESLVGDRQWVSPGRSSANWREAMADGAISALEAARAEAYSTPLDQIDVSAQDRFVTNTFWPFFERLRNEDPVHYGVSPEFGPYWSVTKFEDIIAIDTNHEIFSSEKNISIGDNDGQDPGADGFELPMFIAMDPPKHDEQRKTIAPIVSSENLRNMAPLIRERAGKILDELPVGEPFDS